MIILWQEVQKLAIRLYARVCEYCFRKLVLSFLRRNLHNEQLHRCQVIFYAIIGKFLNFHVAVMETRTTRFGGPLDF